MFININAQRVNCHVSVVAKCFTPSLSIGSILCSIRHIGNYFVCVLNVIFSALHKSFAFNVIFGAKIFYVRTRLVFDLIFLLFVTCRFCEFVSIRS